MKLKFIITLVVLFLTMNILLAQNKISGNIKDEKTKENIVGVSVYISELKVGAITNKTGDYKIEQIQNGTYLFEISCLGYKKRVERINIHNDTIVNFQISESVTEMNEVVITGVSHTSELKPNYH
jgi:iron complex outermembrane receptor protein